MTYVVVIVPAGRLTPTEAYGTYSTRDGASVAANKMTESVKYSGIKFYVIPLQSPHRSDSATLVDSSIFHYVENYKTYCGIVINKHDNRWIITLEPRKDRQLCKICDRANW